ncbi:prostatic acid phosphatase-like [Branchiostoma floridae]|uniref:Prostatic acid phosphatase-like n=1 Tax=Branchiostoma floridae TaxID=7739 RepID=A0A9J7HQH5_BRAFL|nr:prostatic acid phosphatase-like [Branchiostoma floridae]
MAACGRTCPVFVLILTVFCVFLGVQGERSLQFVSLVYRHGDRSPVLAFPNDKNTEDTWPQGFGQLSQEGMRQHHNLGTFLRNRYVTPGFLNASYSRYQIQVWSQCSPPPQIQVWSTDVDRTLMSAQADLSGLYPPSGDQVWNPDIAWQPIPVHTRPVGEDVVRHFLLRPMDVPCPKYSKLTEEFKLTDPELKKLEEDNKEFLEKLFEQAGWQQAELEKVGRLRTADVTLDALLAEMLLENLTRWAGWDTPQHVMDVWQTADPLHCESEMFRAASLANQRCSGQPAWPIRDVQGSQPGQSEMFRAASLANQRCSGQPAWPIRDVQGSQPGQSEMFRAASLANQRCSGQPAWPIRDVQGSQPGQSEMFRAASLANQRSELFICLFVYQKAHNRTLPAWGTPEVYARLQKLSTFGMFALFSGKERSRLTGGTLLGAMVHNMTQAKDGTLPDSRLRLIMYSAHDTTLAGLHSAMGTVNDLQPPYASCIMVELYREDSGDHTVEVWYRNDSSVPPYQLTVPGCPDPCTYQQFLNATKDAIPADRPKECQLGITDIWTIQVIAGVAAGAFIVLLIGIVVLVGCVRRYRRRDQYLRDWGSSETI